MDVWRSLEAFEAMYDDPTFREALHRTGQQPRAVLQVWPLHNLLAGLVLAPSPTAE